MTGIYNVDPVIKVPESPYLCFSGNPILINDILGNVGTSTIIDVNGKVIGGTTKDNDKGVYRVLGLQKSNFDASKIDNYKKQGTKVGETISLSSFQSPITGEWLGQVNFNSNAKDAISKATQTLGGFMSTHSTYESFNEYKDHAGNFKGAYDLKTVGLSGGKNATPEQRDAYAYEASFFSESIIMTRRDQGNFFAGRASKMLGLSEATMLSGFGAFQANSNKINGTWNKIKVGVMSVFNWLDQKVMGAALNGTPMEGMNVKPVFHDDKVSEDLQRAGYNQFHR
jgi:hypothetical protein